MDVSDPPDSASQQVQPQGSQAATFTDVSLEKKNGLGSSYRHALVAGLIAMGVNFIIAFLKLAVYWLFFRSAALLSEGLHSLGDGINSSILLVGIVRGNRSPDRAHPFGYGLEANFWALFASFILFFIASAAVWGGVNRFFTPESHGAASESVFQTGASGELYALLILVISMAFEVYAIWTASKAVLAEVGVPSNLMSAIPLAYQNINKAKVPTTRYVFFEDTLAFIGALLAFVAILGSNLAVQAGWLAHEYAHIPDALASVLIGLILVALAFNLFLHNKGRLVGSAAPEKLEADIKGLVLSLHGVSQIHDLKTIDQGHTGVIINLKVEVEPDIPVKDVDDLTVHIKEKLSDTFKDVHRHQVFIEVLADETELAWDAKFEALLDEGLRAKLLKPRDVAMLRRTCDFTELVVRDVMIPRPDVDFVSVDTSVAEVAEKMLERKHTRWPVFRNEPEELIGIVHSRDVFRCFYEKSADTSLADIIRDIDIYPENKPLGDLLEEFKRKKLRMAAVADEYGCFEGIVTIEDLMEEIVGEILDEHEEEELTIQFLSPYRVLVSGKYNTEELNEELGLSFPTDEFVTIGGFVFGTLGREPESDDRVMFEDMTLTVRQVERARVTLLIIESPIPFQQAASASETNASA